MINNLKQAFSSVVHDGTATNSMRVIIYNL
nr:MAG TPA: hypothetical protein [Caudoviricetes sp.]